MRLSRSTGAFLPLLGLAACMTTLVPTSGPISLVDITTAPVTQSTWVSDAPFDRLAQARDFAEVTGGVVEFSTHSATLDPYAQLQLDRQIAWMRTHSEAQFDLYGYAEQRGPRPEPHSIALLRAQRVQNHLISAGISANRLRIIHLDQTSHSNILAGRKAQRRVIIELRVS